jgi:hypothetical protein
MSSYNGWPIISLPTFPAVPRSVEYSAQDIVGVSTNPFTAQQQTYNWNNAWLEISVSYQPMRYAEAQAWVAFLMALQGTGNLFQIGDPLQTPLNPLAIGGLTAASSGQTGNVIVTAGGGNQSVGDWIQIGWHLHLITAIAGPSFTIWPQIRESPTAGQGIAITGTQGIWRLKANSRKWSVAVNKLYQITFEAREAL